MEPTTIKFKTIQYLNGINYLSEKQINDLCHLICVKLDIDKSEENFLIIKEACKVYFDLQNGLGVSN